MVSWNSILVEKYNRRRSWLCDAPVTIEYDSSSIELCTITNVVIEDDRRRSGLCNAATDRKYDNCTSRTEI
tara:strand:- start:256 stop:468 length:213 start_codon:yes stop_codon:yes gene_type:complete